MNLIKCILTKATAIGLVAGLLVKPALADDLAFTAQQKSEIENIIHSYLVENPEVLIEVSLALEAKRQSEQDAQVADVMSQMSDAIFNDGVSPTLGNPNGKVKVVEFFDYNCGYCRRAMDKVLALAETNDEIQVVFKEMPVLGDASAQAARASLAAAKQGKFMAFHTALMRYDGRVSETAIQQIAKETKLDLQKFEADRKDNAVQAAIDANLQLADSLFINGTPSFIVNGEIVHGWNEAEVERLIKEASDS